LRIAGIDKGAGLCVLSEFGFADNPEVGDRLALLGLADELPIRDDSDARQDGGDKNDDDHLNKGEGALGKTSVSHKIIIP